jgi:hypothetical protein
MAFRLKNRPEQNSHATPIPSWAIEAGSGTAEVVTTTLLAILPISVIVPDRAR